MVARSIAPLPIKLLTAILTLLKGSTRSQRLAMNRRRLKYGVVGVIVVASVAAPLLIQRHARIQWREWEALSRQQAKQFAELSAENKRLSNLVAQLRNPSLSGDRFSELMK